MKAVLSVEHIAREQKFSDLGVSSLTALKALVKIENAFQVNLPLNSVYTYPTIALMAVLIDRSPRSRQEMTEPQELEVLNGDTSHTPKIFYIVAGAELLAQPSSTEPGTDFRNLPQDLPLHVIGPKTANASTLGRMPVAALASDYLSEVRNVQATGPYYFVATCISATVAFEMARQLQSVEEKVAMLAFLDGRYWVHAGPFMAITRFTSSQYAKQLPERLHRRLRSLKRALKRLQWKP